MLLKKSDSSVNFFFKKMSRDIVNKELKRKCDGSICCLSDWTDKLLVKGQRVMRATLNTQTHKYTHVHTHIYVQAQALTHMHISARAVCKCVCRCASRCASMCVCV
jgi:hypothetical protein